MSVGILQLECFTSCRRQAPTGRHANPTLVGGSDDEAARTGRCGQERLRAGGSAFGVAHAKRRDSPNQSIRPAGHTVRAMGALNASLKSGRDQDLSTDESGWMTEPVVRPPWSLAEGSVETRAKPGLTLSICRVSAKGQNLIDPTRARSFGSHRGSR